MRSALAFGGCAVMASRARSGCNARVIKRRWNPAARAVTRVATLRRRHMRCRLTPSVGTVVARSARSCRDIRVIKRDG